MSKIIGALLTASLSFLVLLAGCGGSGGEITAYKGITTQATVTTSNAKALSADAFSGSQMASAATGLAKETGDSSERTLLVQETAVILHKSVAALFEAPKASGKAVAAMVQNTVNGYSGTYSYSVSVEQSTGACSGTVSYSHFRANSSSTTTLSGSMSFMGQYNQSTESFSSLTISMNNLSSTAGSRSAGMSGTMSYSFSGTTEIVTATLVLADNISGLTYWLRDFTLTMNGVSLTVTGTYYDPNYGFVVISTVTPLQASVIDATPASGQLRFTGSNGTKARLTFLGNGSSSVEADTTGSGTYVPVP
ncbi:hypothetical protein [Geobacter sp. SVR]|uniref:hypothetical protein n=1 Tax=Geobacter sp. SVR TaxID=2495594 RepID=UPI00143F03B9|nr:hypothetical protein [Geobacter sp. SVR]BCS52021.1 hypothetical protein GSVR_03290 [Geobacter sp. SVR]GCF87165.1 hypothetical protein GSbR_37650 [Geobacter sp. SVR]